LNRPGSDSRTAKVSPVARWADPAAAAPSTAAPPASAPPLPPQPLPAAPPYTAGRARGTNNGQAATYQPLFTIDGFGATPNITNVTPGDAAAGAQITITGSGFTGATAVTLANVTATYTVNSDTQITATVPAGSSRSCSTRRAPGA